MHIIEVIPLTLLPSNAPQLLSYFFNKNLEKGSIVEVPLGNRKIRAAVVASTPLNEKKIVLKKSRFQLKQLSSVISEAPQISNNQFRIALWISRHYYAPLGYCLKTVLLPFFLQGSHGGLKHRLKNPLRDKKGCETAIIPEEKTAKQGIAARKPLLLLSGAKDTLANIFPFIKKAAENKDQVVLIVPDITTMEYFYRHLASNYNVVKIFSALSNKKLCESWEKIKSGQADVILGTRQSLFMPFKNLKLIIIDDVLHEFYKSDMTPKYNTPDLAATIANFNGARIIFVSAISGVENYYRLKNKEYELLDETNPRFPVKIADMAEEIKTGNFSMFSREFKNRLLSEINPNNQNPAPSLSLPAGRPGADRHSEKGRAWSGADKKILIFSPRRGHSGVLVCQNCGYSVKCKECGIAFRIHKATNLILVCHHCSRNIKIPQNCPSCGNFKLKAAGPAGTQKIYEEIQKLIEYSGANKIPVLILDADVVKNETEEEEIIKEIKSPGTIIIISTQMIFSHRYDINFDLVVVLNADSLISIPDFRTEERMFYQMEKLLDFLPAQAGQLQKMIIQTYNPEHQAILTASEGTYKNFYDKELETRKIFFYPPYSRLVKISFRHKNRDKASYEARILSGKLKMAIAQMNPGQKIKLIDSHPSFAEKEKGLFVYNIILKISPELEDLRTILKFVPSNWSIDVDPRTII